MMLGVEINWMKWNCRNITVKHVNKIVLVQLILFLDIVPGFVNVMAHVVSAFLNMFFMNAIAIFGRGHAEYSGKGFIEPRQVIKTAFVADVSHLQIAHQ